jgi:hypothetical protein
MTSKKLINDKGLIGSYYGAGLYKSDLQGIDTGESKYAVVCKHGSILAVNSIKQGLIEMKITEEFCDKCRKANKNKEVKNGKPNR